MPLIPTLFYKIKSSVKMLLIYDLSLNAKERFNLIINSDRTDFLK